MSFPYGNIAEILGQLDFGLSIANFLLEGTVLHYLSTIIDIAFVWFLIYKLLTLIQGTRAVQLLKGIIVLFLVYAFSYFFNLNTLYLIVTNVMEWGVLAVIIIFQPELRRALEQLGRGTLFSRGGSYRGDGSVKKAAISKAVDYMAKRRIGALISIERETGLEDYIETGIPMHAVTSTELLINVFIPNTPLHDGAMIIRQGEIVAAACYLPLSESPSISKELGTRHRAALGISEVTDSITIIVSEETGSISLARNGELYRELTPEQLLESLEDAFKIEKQTSSSLMSFWTKKVKRNE